MVLLSPVYGRFQTLMTPSNMRATEGEKLFIGLEMTGKLLLIRFHGDLYTKGV